MPIIAVAGRDTVNNGTIEVRDRDGSNSENISVDSVAQVIVDRVHEALK